MSEPQLPYYDLEFSDEAAFWDVQEDAQRRVFLMPVSIPTQFLAFGVLAPDHKPVFVARGRVRDHLGGFIAQMTRQEARVELYVSPPVPEWLLKKYTSTPPYEGHEYEGPPSPPINGLSPTGTDSYGRLRSTPLWTRESLSTRHVYLSPVADPAEFLALGVSAPDSTVHFALTGKVQEDLGLFLSQMVRDEAHVELHVRPPLLQSLLDRYLAAPPASSEERQAT
ncbi:hypothetical protein [Stigmatella erecta]|uniref:Uncharacterized protein n=1 Tax=Stigmatella erecta TaxID=83460 RepID=A0A1I0KSI0_9BACT|nr:hypothetical protein [Stigmatella erecta]SEU27984.1 hypothetical protein SAMN05443639_11386 [Stigmatella erecta]